MSALASFIKGLPAWLYGALTLGALAGIGMAYERGKGVTVGRAAVQALWDADKAMRAEAENKAVAQRLAENTAQADKQAAAALAITKAHDEEINSVRTRLATAERMRKPNFCASAGPAAAPDTASAGSSVEADPGAGLLPESVDRNIKALILETEEAAATGRACQAFVRENGMDQTKQ